LTPYITKKKKQKKREREREREREKERMKYDSVRVISVAQLASGYFRSIFLFYLGISWSMVYYRAKASFPNLQPLAGAIL